jgi:hypothetical protein
LNGQVGSFKRKVGTRREDSGEFAAVIVICEFEKASLDLRMGFDNVGRIAGLTFAPAAITFVYAAPGYVKPIAFSEKEVTVGTGEWALPGTLSVPVGRGHGTYSLGGYRIVRSKKVRSTMSTFG